MTKVQFKKWFPKQLKEKREFRYLTQEQVAKKTGLSQDWISHFERGRRLPDAYAFYRLQEFLGSFV
jgi:transcriptional regulator with XRE-family HTH domain